MVLWSGLKVTIFGVVICLGLFKTCLCGIDFDSYMHAPPPSHNHVHNFADEETATYWNIRAQIALRDQLLKRPNFNVAKNVIFFLGDGMSIPTVAAARIYKGQLNNQTGEEEELSFEGFPYTGLSKTYCVDKQVADSAATATAYLCGVKANYGTIGVSGKVKYNDCKASNEKENHVQSLATWAQKKKKGTGIVTNTRVTHASPAGVFSHVGNREWECDNDVVFYNQSASDCQDIASQLIRNSPGKHFKVILGGGRAKFLPKTTIDEDGASGQRLDGINLIDEWKTNKQGNAKYVFDRDGLLAADIANTDYLLGLFEPSHLKYNLEADPEKDPSLTELTETAIKMLQKEKEGYFLFVEGGRIDHAHHDSKAHLALDETVQFADAVQKARDLTNPKDTLIVVTADHAHTMSIAGYPNRGNNILGLSSDLSDIDHLSYATLSYANGPGYRPESNNTRSFPLSTEMENMHYQYPALIPLEIESHGGDDVAVFASGPWSQLFSGVYEQNVIPHLIAFASCIGDGLTACSKYYN